MVRWFRGSSFKSLRITLGQLIGFIGHMADFFTHLLVMT